MRFDETNKKCKPHQKKVMQFMKEDNKPTHQGACDSGSRSKDDSVMISEDKQTGYAKSGDVAEKISD